jgi:hypothetical protein
VSSLLRDRIVAAIGGDPGLLLNVDLPPDVGVPIARSASALAAIEEARASLAEELNLNQRLVLEQAFLLLGGTRSA